VGKNLLEIKYKIFLKVNTLMGDMELPPLCNEIPLREFTWSILMFC